MRYSPLLAQPWASPRRNPGEGLIAVMRRRDLPARRIESSGQLATLIGGILLVMIGRLWMLFCAGMMIFAGVDLFSPERTA